MADFAVWKWLLCGGSGSSKASVLWKFSFSKAK